MSSLHKAHIANILANLPHTPGVYQMRDTGGKVIYVGKSKNLKSRVSSYFLRTEDLSMAKRQMVDKIADIEILLCTTEVEALVLETNLIKHLSPKYNILMKDDKNLSYIKITKWPVAEVMKTRVKIPDGSTYYGPYVWGVEQIVRYLRRVFRVRNCRVKFAQIRGEWKRNNEEYTKHVQKEAHLIRGVGGLKNNDMPPAMSSRAWPEISEYINEHSIEWRMKNEEYISPASTHQSLLSIADKAGKTLPCMDYYIGLCPAPCMLDPEKVHTHSQHIEKLKDFLGWNTHTVFADMEADMYTKAKNMEFEEAKKIKDTLAALKSMYEKQTVRDVVGGDYDICVVHTKYDHKWVGICEVRNGQILGVYRHEVLDILGATDEEILVSTLASRYVQQGTYPQDILVQRDILDISFLDFLHTKKIDIQAPQIWPKKDILDWTLHQVREYAYKNEMEKLENKTLSREHMANVLTRLGYSVPTHGDIVFECYDISHTDGHYTYASRVCIVNGKPDTKRYKKYKIKTLVDGQIDDYASHREVMMRRTIEAMEIGETGNWVEGQESIYSKDIHTEKWSVSVSEIVHTTEQVHTKNEEYVLQDTPMIDGIGGLGNMPHLIIIDGGKGQLSSALAGIDDGVRAYRERALVEGQKSIKSKDIPLEEWRMKNEEYVPHSDSIYVGREGDIGWVYTTEHIENEEWRISTPEIVHTSHQSLVSSNHLPPICSIAKRDEEIFLPYQKTPILFQKGTPELMVLQKARDESHRYSITANRSARTKSMKKNILEELPGIWPVTRRKLLKLAGSISELKNIPIQDIQSVCTASQVDTLRDHGVI